MHLVQQSIYKQDMKRQHNSLRCNKKLRESEEFVETNACSVAKSCCQYDSGEGLAFSLDSM